MTASRGAAASLVLPSRATGGAVAGPRVAIVGTGPTGLYTLLHLLRSPRPLAITLLEAQDEAGWGMPYAPDVNGRSLLANIASIEIPPLHETLESWLGRQDDAALARLGVARDRVGPRDIYPRVVLGEFFRAQLAHLIDRAAALGHRVEVLAGHEVVDIELRDDDVLLEVARGGERVRLAFDQAVAATGHTLPDWTEARPGVYGSPYPTSALRAIRGVAVGILGSSLSAIDATVAVAETHGVFLRDGSGVLAFHPREGTDGFRVTLMSRKGLLPEADFHFPIPYGPNAICTPAAVDAAIAQGTPGLLDRVFDLFRRELTLADPEDAGRVGLAALTPDDFAEAYFAERLGHDPFAWAARNLALARRSLEEEEPLRWRYAILRSHEVVERALPHLTAEDLARFDRGWKPAFVDDYATVPHESIERLLALRRAGRMDVLRLGSDYTLDTDGPEPGARVVVEGREHRFPAFVDARGQRPLDAADLPFPTLVAQGAVRPARAPSREGGETEIGGVELDDAFRPVNGLGLHRGLHLLALPFLLHLRPFHQGLTGAEELGRTVAEAILGGPREAERGAA